MRKLGAPCSGLKAALQVKLRAAVDERILELEQYLSSVTGGTSADPSLASSAPVALTRAAAASSAAQGGQEELGAHTRLSVARTSVDSAAVASPVRSSPRFGDDLPTAAGTAAASSSRSQDQRLENEGNNAAAVAVTVTSVSPSPLSSASSIDGSPSAGTQLPPLTVGAIRWTST